jgi:glucose/arabinose dehydrogenase
MHKYGGSLRSVGAAGRILSAAFLLAAIAAPSMLAASNGGLPAVQLTQLPGSLDSPLDVVNAGDGSGRLFVVEQTGHIRVFKNGAFLGTDFLDIHTVVNYDGGERGLLGAAFHPDYANNGYFFVYYTDLSSPVYNLTIARYHVSANPDVADPASALIILKIPHPVNTNHNGGNLMFGPVDHYLYMGTGDGGSGGDPPNNAQNLDVLLGKLIRIDVDGTGAVPCGQATPMPYAIPASNPFVGSGHCEEIWAYGVRNPWRFSFDRSTFDLLIGEVGQELYEEVDFTPASSTGGENYGWRLMEGLHCYNPPSNCDDGSLTLPVLEETHSDGWCAIVGGYRYRGAAIPGLDSVYIFGDLCLGEIWAANESGGTWSAQRLLDPSLTISSFGQDEAGELYVCDLGGAVYRIDPINNPMPTITNVSPNVVIAGDPGFTLDVFGSGFVNGATVQWNGSDRATTFVTSSHLTATISAADIAAAGIESVTVFNPLPGGGTSAGKRFDVNETFLDVPTDYFAEQEIQAIFNAGVTAGCDVRLFCPERTTTRAEMAVFLLKSLLGPLYIPPDCTPPGIFSDVPCPSLYANWIEDLANRGITAGCDVGPPARYCPDQNVLREEMAVFLLKTSQGSGYVPPACTLPAVFADVACPSLYADWIQDLKTRGITAGCGDGTNFCPGDPVLRAEMAAFLTITFNLPLP